MRLKFAIYIFVIRAISKNIEFVKHGYKYLYDEWYLFVRERMVQFLMKQVI